MNWLDIIFVILMVGSVAASFSKGLVREVIGLAAAICGLICGAWFYRIAGDSLRPYVGSQEVANFCGFLLVFLGVILAGWLVSKIAGMVIKTVGLSWLDRLMGAGFGVVRGAVICVAVITAIVAFAPATDSKEPPKAVVNSRLAPYMMETAHAVTMAAPRELRDEFAHRYEQIKRVWEDAVHHGLRRAPEAEI